MRMLSGTDSNCDGNDDDDADDRGRVGGSGDDRAPGRAPQHGRRPRCALPQPASGVRRPASPVVPMRGTGARGTAARRRRQCRSRPARAARPFPSPFPRPARIVHQPACLPTCLPACLPPNRVAASPRRRCRHTRRCPAFATAPRCAGSLRRGRRASCGSGHHVFRRRHGRGRACVGHEHGGHRRGDSALADRVHCAPDTAAGERAARTRAAPARPPRRGEPANARARVGRFCAPSWCGSRTSSRQ